MLFKDFTFRNRSLSDFDCMLCTFGGASGMQVQAGAKISFNTSRSRTNNSFDITSREYLEPLSQPFQFCKRNCFSQITYFTREEVSEITEWLQTKDYFEMHPVGDDYDDIIFHGTFSSVSCIENGDKIYGFEVVFTSKYAWATGVERKLIFDLDSTKSFKLSLEGEEYGSLYPALVKIKVLENGTLSLGNKLEDSRRTIINNCVAGETITIDPIHMLIESDQYNRKIANDFNYIFPRLNKTYDTKVNTIVSNLACKVEIRYSPVRKTGVF